MNRFSSIFSQLLQLFPRMGVCDKFIIVVFTLPHGVPKNLPNDCS
jgi:hypothetical protein